MSTRGPTPGSISTRHGPMREMIQRNHASLEKYPHPSWQAWIKEKLSLGERYGLHDARGGQKGLN